MFEKMNLTIGRIFAVMTTVMIMKRHFLKNLYNKINAEKSWIWSHFTKVEEKKEFAFCDLCMKEVYYSKDYSTSMLIYTLLSLG